MRNGSLSTVFWIWFQDLRTRFWGPEIKHLKAHNFVCKGVSYYLATSTTIWVQMSTGCCCWDTSSEKTVFYNVLYYQQLSIAHCPVITSSVQCITLVYFYIFIKGTGHLVRSHEAQLQGIYVSIRMLWWLFYNSGSDSKKVYEILFFYWCKKFI